MLKPRTPATRPSAVRTGYARNTVRRRVMGPMTSWLDCGRPVPSTCDTMGGAAASGAGLGIAVATSFVSAPRSRTLPSSG